MEFHTIENFLDTNSDDKDLPRFVTKKWIEFYDQSGGYYYVNKEIRIKTIDPKIWFMWLFWCIYVAKRTITVTNPNNAKRNKATIFKNNAPFINWISKINGVTTDNAED